MPTKSILETRIRDQIDRAKLEANKAAIRLNRARVELEYAETDLARIRRDIDMFTNLLEPEPGGAPDNDAGGGVADNEPS